MLSRKKQIVSVIAMCCILVISGCKGKIDKVKDGVWSEDKATTIGKALDNYKGFEKKKWELNKSDNGKEYVEFSGDMIPSKQKLELANSAIEAVPEIKNQMNSINGAVNYYFRELYNNTLFGLSKIFLCNCR
jgi:hypothetical protein